ncbi:unnamed protein product [Peniophora sp. CBMAI 1063]|nr:unnamed protein product [Peniophora sp. CBMAI 1063]
MFVLPSASRALIAEAHELPYLLLLPSIIAAWPVSTMTSIERLRIDPPLINSSCPWASEKDQLQGLFDCPHIGAVTTRTATLLGFPENDEHGVVFTRDRLSSQNSYGYSPHPLAWYVDVVKSILAAAPSGSKKPFILSITTSSPGTLDTMLGMIQALRADLRDSEGSNSLIAVELNTSCPNIRGAPPPAYTPSTLKPLLQVLARHYEKDPTLTIGLKLAPYTYQTQFDALVDLLESLVQAGANGRTSPIAFLTSTNTLGQTLLFDDQTTRELSPSTFGKGPGEGATQLALPTPLGGLAGESIHALSLGNVYSFRRLLDAHQDAALRDIQIIGVGGVTSREALARMRVAGASVVACATFLGREGLRAFEILSS